MFKLQWKNVKIFPRISKISIHGKIFTHLQKLFIKVRAVKFLLQKSNRNILSPDAHHIFVLHDNGSNPPCRQTFTNGMYKYHCNQGTQTAKKMQIINAERHWCLVWPHPNTSFPNEIYQTFSLALQAFEEHMAMLTLQ